MHRGNERVIVLVLLTILVFVGCSSLMATPIIEIRENPRAFDSKTVTVSGEVTELFSLIVIKYFVVKDSTGEIVVVTQKPLPQKGSRITVKGTVQEAFSLGDKQLIVIVEGEEK